jgi:hypothetical protein
VVVDLVPEHVEGGFGGVFNLEIFVCHCRGLAARRLHLCTGNLPAVDGRQQLDTGGNWSVVLFDFI